MRRELRSLVAEAHIPALLVTHDKEEALALGDAVQVIDRGRSLARGRPLAVLGQPGQGRVARLLGVENLWRLEVESRHPQDGTMVCVGPQLRLEVPLDYPSTAPRTGPSTGSGQPPSAKSPQPPLKRGAQRGTW